MFEKTCERCGRPYKGKRATSRFCSAACRHTQQRDWTCATCGTAFQRSASHVTNPATPFCSAACANGRNHEQHQWTCKHCGKPFHRHLSRIRKPESPYCSTACYHAARCETPIHTLTCEVCGKAFDVANCVRKRVNPRFCSVQCAGQSHRKGTDGKPKASGHKLAVQGWRQRLGWKKFATAWIRAHPSCARCAAPKQGRNLVVHHPDDPNPTQSADLLFRPSNLQVLCRSCHASLHQASGC